MSGRQRSECLSASSGQVSGSSPACTPRILLRILVAGLDRQVDLADCRHSAIASSPTSECASDAGLNRTRSIHRPRPLQQLAEVRREIGRRGHAPTSSAACPAGDLDAAGEAFDLAGDLAVAGRASPPYRGHDAVGAAGVASHRDRTPGLERPLAHGSAAAPRTPAPLRCRAPALDAETADAEPVAQVRDRAGAEGHVDERVQIEQALPLSLGVAAAHRADALRIARLSARACAR